MGRITFENFAGLDLLVSTATLTAVMGIIVLAAVAIDLIDALYTARRTGEEIRSRILRKTVAKLGEYWRVLATGALADTICVVADFYRLPYTAILIALGLVSIELKSLLEHARKRKSAIANLPGHISDTLQHLRKE